VILEWLLALNYDSYSILEIGCGTGYLGKLIIEGLLKSNKAVEYEFSDLLPECIRLSKEMVKELESKTCRIRFRVLDVYEIEEKLMPGSQSIILSTGFASAATYVNAVPKVAQVLDKNGVLICDFVNNFSPLLFLNLPLFFRNFLGFLWKKKPYFFGKLGLKSYFGSHQLEIVRSQTLNWKRNPILMQFKKVNHQKTS
jgi:SAM-dependent methyltransferase